MPVHPTAIVDPRAELDPSAVIGPYVVIEGPVRIGARTRVLASAYLTGATEIGADNVIHPFAVLGHEPQDLAFAVAPTGLRIGDGNVFREHSEVHRGTQPDTSTEIGNGNFVMSHAHVAHNCRIGNNVILANGVNLAGHVRIDDYAIIGGMTPVHQYVAIGCHAFVGGGSRGAQDVPPYVKAAGNPLRACGLNSVGMERRGIPAEVRLEMKRAYRILYRSQLNVMPALDRITRELRPYPEIHEFVEFVRASERGIVR